MKEEKLKNVEKLLNRFIELCNRVEKMLEGEEDFDLTIEVSAVEKSDDESSEEMKEENNGR